MKHITLFILLAISSLLVNAQGWMWAKHFNGTGSNQPVSISQDNVGNYYVYGNFKNQVTQDAITLNSYSGSQDIFLAKYNPLGEVQWLKQIGGTGIEIAYSLSFNSDYSSFYITGNFNNTFNIEGTYLNTIGGLDVFMAKFSANGTLDWAKNVAYGTTNQTSSGICIDNDSNIVMVGMFLNNVSFYGGVYTLTSQIPSVRQNFIAKFNSSGIPLWSKMIDGDNAASYIRSVSTNNNEYYFSGQYMGTLDFGTSSITNSNSNKDGFVYKTNTNGDFQWVRKISGSNYDEYIIKHVQDGTGNVYTGGYFYSSSLVIDSTATVTSNVAINNHYSGKSDIVILKYSSDGTLQWVKAYGSNKYDVISDIYATQNNVLFTGSYSDSINFNGFNLLNSGGSDAFTAVCSSSTGIVSSALKAAGPNSDYGKTCFYNSNERNFVTSGEFFSTSLTIGSYTPFTNSVQDLTTRDAYIARYGCFDSLSISSTSVTCYGGNNGTAIVTPSEGSAPYSYLWSNSSTNDTITGITAGTYYVTVTGDNNCTATASVTVTQPNILTSDTSQTNVSCYGGNNGTATVIPAGGTPSYTYLWSNSQTNATAIDLVAGVYYVTVTDANNCTTTNSVTITEPAVLTATTSITNPTSNSSCDGTASVTPSGGTTPYTYLWNTSPAQTNATATGLCGGTRSVTVTDYNGCTVTKYVTLVPKTKLRDDFCNDSLSSTNELIYCDGVSGSVDYEFWFVNASLGYDQTITTVSVWGSSYGYRNYLKLYYLPGIQYGYTYDVKVRAKISGVWGEYGTLCQLTLLGTKLSVGYCGSSYYTTNTTIYCNGISGVTNYEFRFVNTSAGYDQSKTTADVWGPSYGYKNYMKLFNIPSLQFGLTYSVTVRAYLNGQWIPYGDICYLTLSVSLTKLRDDFCGATGTTSTLIYCDQVLNVQEYEFWFARTGFSSTRTTSSVWPTVPTRNYMRVYQVPGVIKGYTYDVRIRAKVGGVWGDYGTTCQFIIPASKSTMPDDEINKAIVYPNPFINTTTLLLEGGSGHLFTVLICDITGKVISNKKIFANEEYSIGSDIETGIYFVVITGDNYKETIELIKVE